MSPVTEAHSIHEFRHPDAFIRRHVGPDAEEQARMLAAMGFESLTALIDATVPAAIRSSRPMALPAPQSEYEALRSLREMAARNRVLRSYLGLGYHDCVTPAVIQRNILENPGWYTQYTPYQAEISQGRLESLLNFQTMVADLTGLDIANASLLDEATAAAEAMMLCHAAMAAGERSRFLVSSACHPQTMAVVKTRAEAIGITVDVVDARAVEFDKSVFGLLLQYPDTEGAVRDYSGLAREASAAGALVVVAADLLSLTLLRPPGEWGADVCVGSAQRFGVPLGFGGPHAAFFATRDAFKRLLPGRLVGVSRDAHGQPACRLSLQTREQHIRREKATSNICTAQALLANVAAMYAVYHGPEGLRDIARHVRRMTLALARAVRNLGLRTRHEHFFDTLVVELGTKPAETVVSIALDHGINLRPLGEHAVLVALDETATLDDIGELIRIFNRDVPVEWNPATLVPQHAEFPAPFQRTSPYLLQPVFNRHHSETQLLRYIKQLEARDLSLTHSMIPLGSCTMKLNAAAEMLPISWPGFAGLHPFAPADQTEGYRVLFGQLEAWLAEITGFAAVSLQPNAGSQGEYAGLLAIRGYHIERGEAHRNVCLIPTSAHGTNPASAVMAGLTVMPVACDREGNIDLVDLEAKARVHAATLSCLMVTYPSTHGVFEESIKEVCRIAHEHGGQVYMDGANLNAQVGLCRPAELGADVCHINLHKTFCIPHGGGGPGMGPICVASHLRPFLPGHPLAAGGAGAKVGPVSAAPWGSASLLPISWAYIAMMGAEGLTQATRVAILNANYIAHRLAPHYPVLYKGKSGRVAHECILDLRPFKKVTVEDVAKRLMDYGFHAPTISWPVGGTMMIEPTESESKEELDRFCDAMIAIRAEIQAVESGEVHASNNVLRNAPHTARQAVAGDWDHPYTREQAVFPVPWLRQHKFWPAVGRIDNVHGDRNLVCSCAGMESYGSAS